MLALHASREIREQPRIAPTMPANTAQSDHPSRSEPPTYRFVIRKTGLARDCFPDTGRRPRAGCVFDAPLIKQGLDQHHDR
jgi:hypothetical protein